MKKKSHLFWSQTVANLFLARRFAMVDAPTPPAPGLYLLSNEDLVLVMRFPPAPNLVIVPKENIIYCKAIYYLDSVVGRGLPLGSLPFMNHHRFRDNRLLRFKQIQRFNMAQIGNNGSQRLNHITRTNSAQHGLNLA